MHCGAGGERWHWLRSGEVTLQTQDCNKQGWPDRLDELILPMISPNLEQRPSAEAVLNVLNMMQQPLAPPEPVKDVSRLGQLDLEMSLMDADL